MSIALISFMIVDLVMIGLLSWFSKKDQGDKNYNFSEARYFLVFIALTICVAGLFFVVYEFIRFFCLKESNTITPINKTAEKRKGRKKKKDSMQI